jgi:hypothetical protein
VKAAAWPAAFGLWAAAAGYLILSMRYTAAWLAGPGGPGPAARYGGAAALVAAAAAQAAAYPLAAGLGAYGLYVALRLLWRPAGPGKLPGFSAMRRVGMEQYAWNVAALLAWLTAGLGP